LPKNFFCPNSNSWFYCRTYRVHIVPLFPPIYPSCF
jgi:hypothetical protein